MPSYDFICKDCGHRFTIMMSVADYEKHSSECPKCNSRNIRRTISPFSVITSKKS